MGTESWKLFAFGELEQAFAHADAGGISVHHGGDDGGIYPGAPAVFRGRPFAHLFAKDEAALVKAAASVGCKASWIQREYPRRGRSRRTHFDLVGRTYARAKRLCEVSS